MKIDGKIIAEHLLNQLRSDVVKLKQYGVTPALAVIQMGDNPATLAYIRQKQKAAERIGARMVISNSVSDITRLNNDPLIHGLIVQRPVPAGVGEYHVALHKDVDGFEHGTPYDVPVALAVLHILQTVNCNLSTAHFVVIGRGETAGKPIAAFLQKKQCTTSIIHAGSPNPSDILRKADVIISCVGKERIVTRDSVKPGAIVVSVGLWRDETGKLRGDYEEEEIAGIASYYTPTPGGVGPVNVACLMQNLVKASKISLKGV